jgi:hypothetical protein
VGFRSGMLSKSTMIFYALVYLAIALTVAIRRFSQRDL